MARVSLFEHRKFKRLSVALRSRALALGSLELIWHGCYQTADDYVGDAVDVEAAADWRGKVGALTSALEIAGFIERDPDRDGYRVHDLFQHAPQHVRERFERELARRQAGESLSDARSRAGKAGRAAQLARASAGQAPDTSGQVPKQAPASAGHVPASAGQVATVRRGEARRGEARQKKKSTGAVDPLSLLPLGASPRFDFEALYKPYPRHEGKADGMEALAKIIRSDADFARFAAAVDRYADRVRSDDTERKHTLLWSTFCNGRWLDFADAADEPDALATEYQPCTATAEEIAAAEERERQQAQRFLAGLGRAP